jgi:HSP20 family molecular chaperone IbpA
MTTNRELQQQAQAEREPARRVARPLVDIFETDDRIVVIADLPGVRQDGLELTIDRGVLTIRGEVRRLPDAPLPEGLPTRFERAFTLPEIIDPEGVDATLEQGVLTLAMTKRREAEPRRIEVRQRGALTAASTPP